jgi:hypothetical protein
VKSPQRGLSQGLKAGIAIVSISAALIVLGALFYSLKKGAASRNTTKDATSRNTAHANTWMEERHELPGPQSPSSFMEKPELHGNTSPYALYFLNLLGGGRAELHGTSKVRASQFAGVDRSELHGISAENSRARERQKEEDIAELDGTSKE